MGCDESGFWDYYTQYNPKDGKWWCVKVTTGDVWAAPAAYWQVLLDYLAQYDLGDSHKWTIRWDADTLHWEARITRR